MQIPSMMRQKCTLKNKITPRTNHPYVDTNIQVRDAKSMSAVTTNLKSHYIFILPAMMPPGSPHLSRARLFDGCRFNITPSLHKPGPKKRGTVLPYSPMSPIVPIHKQCM
ncbi:uncharacterized protein AKAW2_60195S [Aspergillus luchuensis]|uniref:Uncharacterized protein n=1 Tax=Aspergillus kawachii TaxID=1069201 RepID=A0A7R8A1A2_ASPKA|nr:uncharacterized protein AKAW2_60195S [Aspergillus luchuensis]BCS01931.1 hypothetical protein AKAW2_60195S [Aspergillus luchuensis]